MHQDQSTTLAELREVVRLFVAERDWQQFHAPKNLAMALAIEASELMEHFQWISVEQSRQVGNEPAARAAVADELADVFCYVLAMANEMQIDLASAFAAKMQKNIEKYPADLFRGRT